MNFGNVELRSGEELSELKKRKGGKFKCEAEAGKSCFGRRQNRLSVCGDAPSWASPTH
jgi:hypothetical protein